MAGIQMILQHTLRFFVGDSSVEVGDGVVEQDLRAQLLPLGSVLVRGVWLHATTAMGSSQRKVASGTWLADSPSADGAVR